MGDLYTVFHRAYTSVYAQAPCELPFPTALPAFACLFAVFENSRFNLDETVTYGSLDLHWADVLKLQHGTMQRAEEEGSPGLGITPG